MQTQGFTFSSGFLQNGVIFAANAFPEDNFFSLAAKLFDYRCGGISGFVVGSIVFKIDVEEVRSIGIVMTPNSIQSFVASNEVAGAAFGFRVVEPVVFLAGGGEDAIDVSVVANFWQVATQDIFDVGFQPVDRIGIVDALSNESAPIVCRWIFFCVGHSYTILI